MSADPSAGRRGPIATALAGVLIGAAILYTANLPRRLDWALFVEQYLFFGLGITLALVYLTYPLFRGPWRWIDRAAAAAGIAACGYMALYYPLLFTELVYKPLDGLVVGVVLVLLTLEAVRRTTGIALTIVILFFVVYALVGHLLPGPLATRPVAWDRLAIYLALDTNAMTGLPLNVGIIVVIPFILMGQLLARMGGGAFFNDLALSLVGRTRGGAAKIAVVSSFMFGSISGSAVANVASSGVVTIPLMKRAGYPPHVAASVEALASTGGQLAPPIMGAAAFLMAEYLSVSYATVVAAAVLPTLLYYFALFVYVDIEALAKRIYLPRDVEVPRFWRVLLDGWHFVLPFVILIYGLFGLNWRPELAALAASASLAVLGPLRGYRGQRVGLRTLAGTLPGTGFAVLDIIVIAAAAGLVIGALNISGLAFSLTQQLVLLAEGSLIILLIAAAGVSVILGMGMPTVGVYVLLASLIGPAMTRAGLDPIAAHMFLLYYGMLSMITPPVALASFTAASMAGADPWRTGWRAIRMGWVAYLIPFVIVFEPGLVMQAEPLTIVWHAVSAFAGVVFVTTGIYGHLSRPLIVAERAGLIAAGLIAVLPLHTLIGVEYVANPAGLLLGALLLWRASRPGPAGPGAPDRAVG
ncbi:MAG: TRAP transporter fused permease subunit [Azospirillaceae bacterium]